jgi:hypothetical protein
MFMRCHSLAITVNTSQGRNCQPQCWSESCAFRFFQTLYHSRYSSMSKDRLQDRLIFIHRCRGIMLPKISATDISCIGLSGLMKFFGALEISVRRFQEKILKEHNQREYLSPSPRFEPWRNRCSRLNLVFPLERGYYCHALQMHKRRILTFLAMESSASPQSNEALEPNPLFDGELRWHECRRMWFW